MTIERWEPFRDMISLREALNSLLAESFVRQGGPPSTGGATMLPLDVAETEGEFVIKASLPGIKPEDVHITVYGDTLTIRGESKAEEEKKGTHWHVRERRVSSFARSLSLGAPIHADAASPLRPRRPDADLAQDGGGQAEADQGGGRPDTAPIERSAGSSRSGARYVRHRQARPRPSAVEAGREARADPLRRRRAGPRGARGRNGPQRRGVEPGADGGYRPGRPAGGAAGPVIPASENRIHHGGTEGTKDNTEM